MDHRRKVTLSTRLLSVQSGGDQPRQVLILTSVDFAAPLSVLHLPPLPLAASTHANTRAPCLCVPHSQHPVPVRL